jgi:glycosyltransferase involved in cell wall biosynthesis
LTQLPTEPFVLFVGAFRRVKGITHLLEAYQQLHSPPPLVMIGTVEVDTPRDFPAGVIVLQDFPHPVVMKAWERSLFGVLPSLWPEPLGSVVYEGMSKGKAIIGTTPGGHTDMILDNVTGILVPAGDIQALAVAMQKLIDDPELCRRLGDNGLERSKIYTADMTIPAFEGLYSNLLLENDV